MPLQSLMELRGTIRLLVWVLNDELVANSESYGAMLERTLKFIDEIVATEGNGTLFVFLIFLSYII